MDKSMNVLIISIAAVAAIFLLTRCAERTGSTDFKVEHPSQVEK